MFNAVKAFILISYLFTGIGLHAQTAELWTNFLESKKSGTQATLPDYSFSGYHFSEKQIPDVSSWQKFDVTDYGAVADDTGYDDAAIQAAIDAAELSGSPAVVFFPAGKFIVSSDNDIEKSIEINESNIVLKGSGSGAGGTEIFMDKMRVNNGHWQFRIQPESFNTSTITSLTKAANRDDFSINVASTSGLTPGQTIYLSHRSEAFARAHFGGLELSDNWSRLFGEDGGMNLYECHIVDDLDGNVVTLKNPIQTDLPELDEPYLVRNLRTIEEVGVEDILFTSDWESYPEEFVHHKDDIHDYAWNALQFKYVKNGWMRNCEFRHWNQVVDVRESIGVTIENVKISGKQGHASFLTRRSYGLLVKDCIDESSSHHGPGTGYGGVSTVYLRHTMSENQSIDSHSGQPYCTLFDDSDGGDFHTNGGPHESYPHHGRGMTFWNFIHKNSSDVHYDFWSVDIRKPATYADPIFVGLQPTNEVTFTGEGSSEFQGTEVYPKSLFEAQLDYRLNPPQEVLNVGEQLQIRDNKITIYPNPFTSEVTMNDVGVINSIKLYDMDGKSINIISSRTETGIVVRPVSDISNGVYHLKILLSGNENLTYRVIKK